MDLGDIDDLIGTLTPSWAQSGARQDPILVVTWVIAKRIELTDEMIPNLGPVVELTKEGPNHCQSPHL